MADEKDQVAVSELAKATEEVLDEMKELAKSQICTGSQPKVSHPDSTTSNQTDGDAVAENGTDYRGGSPRRQDTKLRKALMDKIHNNEPLTDIEKALLDELLAAEAIEKGKHADEKEDKKLFAEMMKEKDSKKVEKAIQENEEVRDSIDAAPVLKSLADVIAKGFEELSERIAIIEKAIPASAERVDEVVKSFGENIEAFNTKHAELSVHIAKSVEQLAGAPARGSRAAEAVAADVAGEEVAKSVEGQRPVDQRKLVTVMSDVLVSGRAGEFGLTDDQLAKAVTRCESAKEVQPDVVARFADLIQ